MMILRQQIVNREEDGTSLQKFLMQRLNISRKRAKALLDRRQVFVNRRRVWMAHHKLHQADQVETAYDPAPTHNAVPSILFDDSYYVIVNKRAGFLSNGEKSVESVLRAHLQCPDLQAVHRLDRDTSGCLLFARSEEAFAEMRERFRQHDVRKNYHVLVQGAVRRDKFTLDTPIDNRRAATHVRVFDSSPDAAHILVKIATGRTHQIRKHLFGIGHPVLGDRTYGVRRRGTSKSIRIGRQMLHASELSFRHPFTRQIVRAKAPLPADFRNCMKTYRLT